MDAVIKYGVGGDCSHRFGRLQYIFFNFFFGREVPSAVAESVIGLASFPWAFFSIRNNKNNSQVKSFVSPGKYICGFTRGAW